MYGQDPSVALRHHEKAPQCVVQLSALKERFSLLLFQYLYHQPIFQFYGDRV